MSSSFKIYTVDMDYMDNSIFFEMITDYTTEETWFITILLTHRSIDMTKNFILFPKSQIITLV